MAFLPGIFGSRNQSAQPQPPAPAAPVAQAPAPAHAGAQQTPANPAVTPAGMATVGMDGANAGGPVNPLDSYVDYFKPKATDPNAQKAPSLSDPLLSPLDPAAFRQQIAQSNFAAAVPQDVMQRAVTGDVTAFTEAINIAAREAFAASAQLSHGLVEHGARTAGERVSSTLDGRIRNFQVRSQNTSNEALSHPAVAPMLNAVKMQIAQGNPNLSAEQVQLKAEQYFTQMADVLTAPNKQAQAASQQKANSGTDFSDFLN